MKGSEIKSGDTISFKYNGRCVRGIVTYSGEKSIMVLLTTLYKGKNTEWEAGQVKECYKALIKKLILNSRSINKL